MVYSHRNMALLSPSTALVWFLVTVHVMSADAAGQQRQRRRLNLAVDEADRDAFLYPRQIHDNTVELRSDRPPETGGLEPGDAAAAFRVTTLDGEFVYQPGDLRGSLIIHAFTGKSAFLECMWSSESSLTDLVEELPDSAQVLFLSLDDSAASDAVWMRDQVRRAATHSRKTEVLSRLHFSPVPVFALGNWIPSVLYSWVTTGRNSLVQAVFKSEAWKMPIIVKRLDARYDWLMGRWGRRSYQLFEAGDGCQPSPSVAGAVAWVSEGNCSFFTKVESMVKSNASGVLVYALPGHSIQDMNCVGDECSTPLGIPAAMVALEPSVAEALRFGQPVDVSFQVTPSPNLFIGIDQQGTLAEMGWLLYPTFRFINWQAQWFDFHQSLHTRLQTPARVVSVFDKVTMHGEKGAVATVDLPIDLLDLDTLELDASLSCPGRRDSSCAPWDRTVQLFVCCDHSSPFCNVELGRWITAFRRGTGHWLTDVSPLIPLLNNGTCTFTMKTQPWAKPWVASLNLRFSSGNQTGPSPRLCLPEPPGGPSDPGTGVLAVRAARPLQGRVPVDGSGTGGPGCLPAGLLSQFGREVQHTGNRVEKLRPFKLMPLYGGGTFDKNYNKRFQPITFTVPAATKKVELYAVITGHGSDENSCAEFCVTSHHFLINGVNNTLIFDSAGTPLGCTMLVKEGAVPNEYGTWLYGRGGWCDGLQVNPWRVDITSQLNTTGYESNALVYFGMYEGRDPNPARDPGYIIMSSFLVFYK